MIANRAFLLWVGAWLLAAPEAAQAAARVEPSPAALELVKTLPAQEMGVDRSGNLWVWNFQAKTVELISPAGGRLNRLQLPDGWLVDADTEWGVAGLFKGGRELRWLRWDGTLVGAAQLPGPAADVCWISAGTVAVTPEMASHRVEVWDLEKATLRESFGEETPLQPAPGATRLRTVVLRYDFARHLLYTLESFTGELKVFTHDGKLAWKAQVDNPDRAELEAWLKTVDARAKARGDLQTPTIYVLSLALDAEGNPWVIGDEDRASQSLALVKLAAGGNETRALRDVACPSLSFVVWGEWLIAYRETPSGDLCNATRRLQ
jgi:hypothetical protein